MKLQDSMLFLNNMKLLRQDIQQKMKQKKELLS